MNLYIRNSESLNNCKVNKIEVIYNVPFDLKTFDGLPAEVTPETVCQLDSRIDEQEWANYDALKFNVYAALSPYFDVIDETEDEKFPDDVFIFAKTNNENISIQFEIHLILSDSKYFEQLNGTSIENVFVQNGIRKRKWWLEGIFVNENMFKNYDNVEDVIYDEIESYMEKVLDING